MHEAVTYEIRGGSHEPCELVSIVKTSFGGDAVNVICSGTHTYCESIRQRLIVIDACNAGKTGGA